MKKIRHGNNSTKWDEAIQIAAHNYNTFPSASNGYSPFLLYFERECSNPLLNKLNPVNTVIRQGTITTSVHELHNLWKAHAAEIRKNRVKNDNPRITEDPPLNEGDRVLIITRTHMVLIRNSLVIGRFGSSTQTNRPWFKILLETSEHYP